jgi:DNA polymerase III alpha subunit
MVNRRVIESLIKAGAFDSLKSTRAGLLAALDQAMEAGQRRQREREEGQGSLFEALGGSSLTATADGAGAGPPQIAVAEWPHEQLLAYEKEVLGFYLSGHPLERYEETARRLGSITASEVATRPVGALVKVLGQIGNVRERATKSGNRMAFAILEVVDGAVALTIFPEPLKTCGAALRHPGPVLVRGRVDDTDKGRVVLAEEITAVDAVQDGNGGAPRLAGARTAAGAPDDGGGNGRHAHTCRIRLRAELVPDGDRRLETLLGDLRAACQARPGPTPVFLHVLLAEHEVVVKVTGCRVDPAPELVDTVERLLGEGSVTVEYAGRA